jgi:hypothetical protein
VCDPAHLDEPEEALSTKQAVVPVWVVRVPSRAKLWTLMSAARRLSIYSLGDCLMWLMSKVISVGAGRGSLGIMGAKNRGGRGWLGHAGRG